jgi:hypothetical protein
MNNGGKTSSIPFLTVIRINGNLGRKLNANLAMTHLPQSKLGDIVCVLLYSRECGYLNREVNRPG